MQNNKTIRKASLDDLKQIYLIEKDVFSNEHWTLEMVESELKNLTIRLKEHVYKIPGNNGFGYQIKKAYVRLLSIAKDLTTENIQKSDLDLSERYRYLIFRILTGIGIASVVLVTGLMSKIFDIPLPMLNK